MTSVLTFRNLSLFHFFSLISIADPLLAQHDHAHMHNMPSAINHLNAFDFSGFASIFSFSFLASFHCALMCAPLVCALLGPKSHFKNRELWLYNLGRGISYTCMGLFLGTIGLALKSWSQSLGVLISWSIGIFLILAALKYWFPTLAGYFLKNKTAMNLIGKLPIKLFRPNPNSNASGASMFVLGLTTVLLPCMTLTPTLAMAAATQSGVSGALTMLAFFAGTVPAMLLSPGLSATILRKLPVEKARKMGAIFLLLAGIITIWRNYH